MSKRLASRTLGRVFGRQQSQVGQSSSRGTTPEAADPTRGSVAQQTVDLYSTEGATGIRVVADPSDAALDIVFVHGLTGNREKTWTHPSGVFWPQELAKDIPTARIMTFGYDADVVKLWGMAGSNTLRNHGKSLATDVSDQRRGYRERPLIFIAHSLGGLVCEQALLVCREGGTNLEKVFQSTRGIIFMGTPHGGSDLANWGHVLAKYLKVIRHTNPAIVGVLQRKSDVLTAVQQQFQQSLLKPDVHIGIYCFFEEKPILGVGVIVPEQSAVLNQYPNQSIGANHMDMTKFSGRSDVGYQRVLSRVHDFVELMNSTPVTETYQESSIDTSQNPDLEKENKCQQLLRTSDYERFKDRNPPPVQGTCQWFLRHPNYISWRDSLTSSLLWVSADPGCGKSVLSRLLADRELEQSSSRTICYFFFKDDNEDQKTTTKALCALLHQLFTHKPELLCHAVQAHNQNGDKLIENVDLLWNLLTTASTDPKAGETICILDALDECRHSELKYLLQKVCAFYESRPRASDHTALKFLLTSRPLQYIADEFNDITQRLPTIHLAGEEDTDQIKCEIELVIEDELQKIQQKWHLDEKTLSPLREELSKVEHRTYLWLKLIFELIRKDAQSITKRGRLKIFGTIPDSVDAAYTAILNQSTDKEQAKKLLQIVCVAVRPLSVREMSIAISIQSQDETLGDLEIPPDDYSKNLIRNLCGLFVSVIDGRVYLLHQTAKEYLIGERELSQSTGASDWIWKHSLSMKDSDFILAHICIWYLRLKGFDAGNLPLDGRRPWEILVFRYDFLEYASCNWALHFREASIPMDHVSIELALDICNTQAYPFTIWWLLYWKPFGYNAPFMKLSTLHLASRFGHQGVVGQLLATPGIEVNKADEYGRTPLWRAASEGHAGVVGQLLAMPGIEVNKADEDGQTPLWRAASEGNAGVVGQLLAMPGIEVNKAGKDSRTPLCRAADEGNAGVVGQLLAMPGIEVNKADEDEDGRTPLWRAASEGHAGVVGQLLAMPGIEVNKADKYGQTPLCRAADKGHTGILSQLLNNGADIEFQDEYGQTLLSRVIEKDDKAVAELCLATGRAEPDSKDRIHRTPLFYAAKNGNKVIIELLIPTTRVNIDSKDYYNSTALSIAARRGHKGVVAFLLPKSQSWNAQDTFGRTALWWAKRNGYFEIADLLLKKYEDNGIINEEDDLPVTTMLFISNEGNRYCDVCVLDISAEGTYYHCEVCNSGDFDICEECLALKASCLDKSHVLTQRTPAYKTLI